MNEKVNSVSIIDSPRLRKRVFASTSVLHYSFSGNPANNFIPLFPSQITIACETGIEQINKEDFTPEK